MKVEVDTRFISAAAEMLDQLYLVLPILEDAEGDTSYKPGVIKDRVKAVRAAIAKAEGK